MVQLLLEVEEVLEEALLAHDLHQLVVGLEVLLLHVVLELLLLLDVLEVVGLLDGHDCRDQGSSWASSG